MFPECLQNDVRGHTGKEHGVSDAGEKVRNAEGKLQDQSATPPPLPVSEANQDPLYSISHSL